MTITRCQELDNKDHDFAKYLRKNGWIETDKIKNCNRFYAKNSVLIAMVIYDNTACTYEVFCNKNEANQ